MYICSGEGVRTTRALAAALAALVVLVAVAFALPATAHAANKYGQLCAKYESGTDPYAADDSNPYGGDVFGAFQMSYDNAVKYAQWLETKYKTSNTVYAGYGTQLLEAHKKDSGSRTVNFTKAWKAVFPNKKSAYLQTQYLYVKKAYYDVAVRYWKAAAPGFMPKNYSVALRNVIFSTAVQHGTKGSADNVFSLALKTLGGWKDGMDEKTLIQAIYAERARVAKSKLSTISKTAPFYRMEKADAVKAGLGATVASSLDGKYLVHFYSNPSATQVGVYNRLAIRELKSALELYGKYSADTCKHAHTSGGEVARYYALTDKNHKEDVSAVVCKDCGTTVQNAQTRTVKNVFVQKGASWKDVSGRKYTVHAKGYYSVATDSLNVRAKAKAGSAVRTSVANGVVLKVSKASMGKDGFWWGKVSTGGSKGYVQMQYLAKIGTASAQHKYKKNVCIYCGATKAQIKRIPKLVAAFAAGSRDFVLSKKANSYKVAYASDAKLKKALKKGTALSVTKVVKNRLGDYWAKLSGGGYIELRLLKLPAAS